MKKKGQRVTASAGSVGDKRSSYISNGQYFAFTFKRMGKILPTSEEYENWLHLCRLRGMDIQYHVYELDETERRLHVHGIAIIKDYKEERYILASMHKLIKEIPDNDNLKVWNGYCEKTDPDPYQQEQLCQTNDIQVSDYPFTIIKSEWHPTYKRQKQRVWKWDQHSDKTTHCYTDAEVDLFLADSKL